MDFKDGENIIDHIGEIGKNRFGTSMKIVMYRAERDIDVEFLDVHHFIKEHVTYGNFKKGNLKNPYDKSICGIGYIGVGQYMAKISGKDTKQYETWKNLIERCYGNWGMYTAYSGISTVCEEWHNYQNFARWYDKNRYVVEGRLHIDKDILFPGNKEYAPDKCLLVPQRINMMFVGRERQGGLPTGIKAASNGRYSATYNTKHLGTFDTLGKAYTAYAAEKEKHIKRIADEYRGILPKKVYRALYIYQVPDIDG